MAQTLNKIVFIFTLALFSLSAYHVLKHWNYQEALADLNQSVRHQITQKAISNEIQSAINKAEFDDARMYLSIAHSNNYLLDFSYYQQQINRKDTQLRK